MTFQTQEKLFYNGKTYYLETEPLDSLFELMGDGKPVLVAQSSGCWRGYVGTWEIENDRLFLIDFKGHTTDYVEVSMDFLFLNPKKVFAEWFTGEIKIPQGKSRVIAYGIYRYEKYWYLEFNKGVLVGSREEEDKNFNKDITIGRIEF